jgi:hypothetical protein
MLKLLPNSDRMFGLSNDICLQLGVCSVFVDTNCKSNNASYSVELSDKDILYSFQPCKGNALNFQQTVALCLSQILPT